MGDSELSVESSEEKNNSKETYLVRKEKRIPMKIPEIDVSYSILHLLNFRTQKKHK